MCAISKRVLLDRELSFVAVEKLDSNPDIFASAEDSAQPNFQVFKILADLLILKVVLSSPVATVWISILKSQF